MVEITITGSPVDGFNAAEIWGVTAEEHFIGRVFEQEDGWHYDLLSNVAEIGMSDERFTMEVERAKFTRVLRRPRTGSDKFLVLKSEFLSEGNLQRACPSDKN